MRLRLIALAFGAAVAAASAGSWRGEAGAQDASGEPTGDIIVRFNPGVTLADVGAAIDGAETDAVASTGPSSLVLLEPEPGQSLDDALSELESDPRVQFAEPDTVMSAVLTPTDPLYAAYQWHLPRINAPAAWDTTTGSSGVIIAVLDTGVETTHPDLNGKLTTGANAGYDFINNDTNPADDHSHGTFVAGIIAANTNNGQGGAGVCWSCKIMAVKVLGADGTGSAFGVAQGIDWAVSHGADVINMSLSGGHTAALETAVNNAWSAGVVLIAATGNDNSAVGYPAAYANAIAVGSHSASNARSSFSNYGPETDLVAPGEDILGPLCNCGGNPGGYGIGSGTSFAAPQVAGVAGLLIASGVTDKTQIRSRLIDTTIDITPGGFDNQTGWGRLDAAAALNGADTTPPSVTITSPANGATVSGVVNITATASDDTAVEKVQFRGGGAYLGFDASAPYTKPWDSDSVADGTQYIQARAVDAAGNASAWVTITVTVSNNPDATPPTAAVTSPANGAVVSGTVNLTGTASDNVGVEKMQFLADGAYLGYDTTAPYTKQWDSTTVPDGVYVLAVRAVDTAGNTSGWRSVTVTVMNSPDVTPPTVNLSAPADGATVSGVVQITATASDDVAVDKVRFWIDGAYVGYDWSAPYTKTWSTNSVSNGTHTIRVQAVDKAGNLSAPVTITVTVSN